MTERLYTAALLIIGNEILSGRTQDANLAYLGRRLNDLGIRLVEVRVVPDREAAIVEAVNALRARSDYLFTTGGIGPTHDDITVEAVARALGLPVIEHPEARRLLELYYGDAINPARLRMARTPAGAGLIENPVSAAPGIAIENVFLLAGVPKIMQAQFESLSHRLTGGKPLLTRTLPVPLPESVVAGGFAALQDRFPDVEMGSYPFARGGRFGTSLVLRATEVERLEAAVGELVQLLKSLGVESPEPLQELASEPNA